MKKCYLLLSILLILSILAGCAKTDYSTAPFFKTEGTDFSPTDLRVKLGMAKIPSSQYETYPSMQNAPISAILYKDGKAQPIDVNDPKLIRLVNLFNNALYHEKCAYVQSYLSDTYLEEVSGEAFRLELKYEPYGDVLPGPYVNNPTRFDTLVVTNTHGFVLINHDQPAYSDDRPGYSVLAAGYSPYSWQCQWLDLLGF